MANEVVLQTAPEFNRCGGILDGVCVLQEVVEQFLNSRQFVNSDLADRLPCDFEFVIGNAETTTPAELATPEITMKRSDLTLRNPAPNPLMPVGSSVVQPSFSISFEIKTAYFKLSELLTLELGQFIYTIGPCMRQYNLNIATVVCGSVQKKRDTTPNYYFSTVTVNASVPMLTWRYPGIDAILRSIDLKVKIQGGTGTSVVELT